MAQVIRRLSQSVLDGNRLETEQVTAELLQEGLSAIEIINGGLTPGMQAVGDMFQRGEAFLPEMIASADAMKGALEILKPTLHTPIGQQRRKVVLGTVKNDLHDIGKNIAASVFQGEGYDVVDLGVDVSPEAFLKAATDHQPDVIGLSAMLTTTMSSMPIIIQSLRKSNVSAMIVVGGAPVSTAYADKIGADVYAADAVSGVRDVSKLFADPIE